MGFAHPRQEDVGPEGLTFFRHGQKASRLIPGMLHMGKRQSQTRSSTCVLGVCAIVPLPHGQQVQAEGQRVGLAFLSRYVQLFVLYTFSNRVALLHAGMSLQQNGERSGVEPRTEATCHSSAFPSTAVPSVSHPLRTQ